MWVAGMAWRGRPGGVERNFFTWRYLEIAGDTWINLEIPWDSPINEPGDTWINPDKAGWRAVPGGKDSFWLEVGQWVFDFETVDTRERG